MNEIKKIIEDVRGTKLSFLFSIALSHPLTAGVTDRRTGRTDRRT